MWHSVKVRASRYEAVAQAAEAEGRSVANMVDRLLERALAEPEAFGGLQTDSRIAAPAATHTGAAPSGSASALDQADARRDPHEASASPSASELAAKIPTVALAGSLVKDATPFPKGKQAGRKP